MDQVPTERNRFVEIGSTVLISSVMAAISMAFALGSALRADLPVTIICALLWGLVILNLNRFLMISLGRIRKRRSLLLAAAPRLALSVVIALVISVPFVLRIFAPEIHAEIPVLRAQQLNRYEALEKAGPVGQKVAVDQQVVNHLQAVIKAGGGPLPDPDKNPAVQSLTGQLSTAQGKEKADYTLLECALYGGPGCPTGQSVQALQAAYQADVTHVSTLQKQLSTLVTQLNATALANQAQALSAADSQLAAAQTQLKDDQNVQQEELANFGSNSGTGILVQLQALSAATAGNASLTAARWLVLFLFFAVDFLPVLTRILLQFGPPSVYDVVVENEERLTVALVRREADLRLLAADRAAAAAARAVARDRWSGSSERPASFTERAVPHADGELHRLEISDDEFLLVDILDGVPTLNWTASIGAQEFTLLVSDRLERRGNPEEQPGEITLSMAGIADQFDARLGVQLAALASPAFDQRSEFIRFDDPDVALALQSLHGDDGEQVKMFGVSASGLALDTVTSLMALTATSKLAAHAWLAGESPLITRVMELVHLSRGGDPALVWHMEGQLENAKS